MASGNTQAAEERNLIPVWDGKPETFSHFVTEVKWTLTATRKDDRPLLAAKIIRKALQSGQSTLVQLMYKLEPEDFRTEDSVSKLVKYLEESPLNRQPLPDAGNKIGGYYRRLQRRNQEALPAFLIREDKVHDDMLKALQRLLRERDLAFDGYETTVDELKAFCGMGPNESLYFGPEAEMDAEAAAAEDDQEDDSATTLPGQPASRSSSASRTSRRGARSSTTSSGKDKVTEVPKARGKDLLQRLMEKGLMPLSALDVIRGWMVLEMSTASEEERRIVKAATRNRLGYAEVRQALLAMYEDRGGKHGRPFAQVKGGKGTYFGKMDDEYHDDYADYTDAAYLHYQSAWSEPEAQGEWYDPGHWGYYQEPEPNAEWQEWPPDEEVGEAPSDKVFASLKGEQKDLEDQKKELEAMIAENDRNLAEARRAVAAAARDRGWGNVQQRQPKPTSAYMSKGGGKAKGPQHKGKKGAKMLEEANWVNHSGKKGKQFSKSQAKGPKGPPWSAYHMEASIKFFAASEQEARSEGSALAASEGLVDTGATATAGGQDAVNKLCAAVAAARPDTKIVIHERERPYFRYGSGKWGRALFKVDMVRGNVVFSIFALPSEGVPVLVGMRELKSLDAFIGCARGRCLVDGRMVQLRKTPKGHLVMDIAEHVFSRNKPTAKDTVRYKAPSEPPTRPPTTSASTYRQQAAKTTYKWVPKNQTCASRTVRFAAPEATQHSYVLELQTEERSEMEAVEQAFVQWSVDSRDLRTQSDFLGLSTDELRYVFGSGDMLEQTCPSAPTSIRDSDHGGLRQRRGEHRHEGSDPGSRSRSRGGGDEASAPGQGQGVQPWKRGEDRVRLHSPTRPGRPGPPLQAGGLAMPGSSSLHLRGEPIRPLDGVRHLRSSSVLRPRESARTNLPQNVVKALERLRMAGWEPETLAAKDVKNMIDIVAKEKRLLTGKDKTNPKKATVESKTTTKGKTNLETVSVDQPADEMEGYEKVEPPQENDVELVTAKRK